jgi:hypothetical protein
MSERLGKEMPRKDRVRGVVYFYLLLGDVDGFVEDDPDGSLPASRVRGRALVGHIVVRVRQQAAQRQISHCSTRTWQHERAPFFIHFTLSIFHLVARRARGSLNETHISL